jgi:hypothetical protein
LYIQTDNPFIVVKRKEIINDDADDDEDTGEAEAGQLDTDQLPTLSIQPKLDPKKVRSISQSVLTNKIKSREALPRQLVRQRSNTIIGHLPVFKRVEDKPNAETDETDAADAEDFEVVDIRSEIFRIKDQFDELLDALDGKLFNGADLEKSCLLKKQM